MTSRQKYFTFSGLTEILDHKIINNENYYLCQWKDGKNSEATWEKIDPLIINQELIQRYEENIQKYGKEFYINVHDPAPQIQDFIYPQASEVTKREKQLENFQIELDYQLNSLFQLENQLNRIEDQKSLSTNALFLNQINDGYLIDQICDINIELPYNQIVAFGQFGNQDEIDKILLSAQCSKTNKIYYKVSWKRRKNGILPINSWQESTVLFRNVPELVCKYLMAKLV